MKNILTKHLSMAFLVTSCFMSCSENKPDTDNEDNNNTVSGTITLTGEETSIFGTSLVVGNIAINRIDLTNGATNSVILLPENTTVTKDSVLFDDPNNGFNILGVDFSAEPVNIGKTVGMAIVKDSIKYVYFCASPVTDGTGAIPCGERYKIDFTEKTVTFDSTTVVNVDSRKILILDGIVNWE